MAKKTENLHKKHREDREKSGVAAEEVESAIVVVVTLEESRRWKKEGRRTVESIEIGRIDRK